jgi:hypothetical protein
MNLISVKSLTNSVTCDVIEVIDNCNTIDLLIHHIICGTYIQSVIK